MVPPQTMSYAELDESSTDDENLDNCHLTMGPTSKIVSKSKVWRCSRNSQPNSCMLRSNICDRHVRRTEGRQPLLVLDPVALQEQARILRFTGTLNIDHSVVHVGPDVTTITDTIHEPILGGNVMSNLYK